jgi:hypothetical protein
MYAVKERKKERGTQEGKKKKHALSEGGESMLGGKEEKRACMKIKEHACSEGRGKIMHAEKA